MKTTRGAVVLLAVLGTAAAWAQAQTPLPATKKPAPQEFSYHSGGRRDPFKDLFAGATLQGKKVITGLSDLAIDDVSLMGIVGMRGKFEAIISLTDGFPISIHEGDRLADGFVLSVETDRVIFRRTHDSQGLPLTKPRDVVKDIIAEERYHD